MKEYILLGTLPAAWRRGRPAGNRAGCAAQPAEPYSQAGHAGGADRATRVFKPTSDRFAGQLMAYARLIII